MLSYICNTDDYHEVQDELYSVKLLLQLDVSEDKIVTYGKTTFFIDWNCTH